MNDGVTGYEVTSCLGYRGVERGRTWIWIGI